MHLQMFWKLDIDFAHIKRLSKDVKYVHEKMKWNLKKFKWSHLFDIIVLTTSDV